MGQEFAGFLLGFFGILIIIAVGLFYCVLTLMWIFAENSSSHITFLGYYLIALVVGGVGQGLGGVLVYTGSYLEGKRRGESEKQLLLGTGLMILRDILIVLSSLLFVAGVFSAFSTRFEIAGVKLGLSIGGFYLGGFLNRRSKEVGRNQWI